MTFRSFFTRYRFTSKLMIAYLLLTVIPMSLLGYISYRQYTQSIENQVGRYIPGLLRQAMDKIDLKLEEFQNTVDLIYNSDEIVSILRLGPPSAESPQSRLLQDRYTVENYLSRVYLSSNYKDILGVFILSKGRIFQQAKLAYEGFEPESILRGVGENDRGHDRIILPYETNLRFEGNPPYLLLVRDIGDFDNRTTLGTMVIAVTLSFIGEVLDELDGGEQAELWLMDESGLIVYHPDSSRIGTRYAEAALFPLTDGSFKRDRPVKELYGVSKSPENGWMLVYRIPVRGLTAETEGVRQATIVAFVLFAAVTGAISLLIAWRFTRPLNRLSKLMVDVQRGNFEVDMKIDSRDEVGLLAHRFNAMVKRIRELILENYQMELRQREAEWYALQFQINPHFMYNTLETISVAVELGEKEKVVDMVALLGRMLRFSLDNRRRIVPIAEELQHAEDFLRIQKYRFEDALEYDIRCDVESARYGTLKVILQPILENSIKYGLEHRQKVRIEMIITQLDPADGHPGGIRIVIRDDGIGMSAERLAEIRGLLAETAVVRRDAHFGLANVHSRIESRFGKPYGLSVESEEGKGTTVIVEIPALPMEEVAA
ncbi:MAG TPA: sensor histidine kinase [Paenibacillaceae bacterium]